MKIMKNKYVKYLTVLDFEVGRVFQYKEKAKQEMDKFLNKLIKKNGTTKY